MREIKHLKVILINENDWLSHPLSLHWTKKGVTLQRIYHDHCCLSFEVLMGTSCFWLINFGNKNKKPTFEHKCDTELLRWLRKCKMKLLLFIFPIALFKGLPKMKEIQKPTCVNIIFIISVYYLNDGSDFLFLKHKKNPNNSVSFSLLCVKNL